MVKESVWQRAWKDTKGFRNSDRFFWGWEVIGAAVAGVIGGMIGAWITPENSDKFWQYLYPAIGGVIGIVSGLGIVFAFIFIWYLLRAPYKQRDDAIEMAMEFKKEYESVLSAVQYKLAFEEVVSRLTKFRDGIVVQVGVRLCNIVKEIIELKIVEFKVILNDKTVEKPKYSSISGFIHPSRKKDFYFEGIKLEGDPKVISGTLKYEVIYSSVPNTTWYKSGRRMSIEVNMNILPVRTSYRMLGELEE
jgi:hypothetical protein